VTKETASAVSFSIPTLTRSTSMHPMTDPALLAALHERLEHRVSRHRPRHLRARRPQLRVLAGQQLVRLGERLSGAPPDLRRA
jgi:hypothetical protein